MSISLDLDEQQSARLEERARELRVDARFDALGLRGVSRTVQASSTARSFGIYN